MKLIFRGLAILVFFLCSVRADYLEVRRDAAIKLAPDKRSATIEDAKPELKLPLVDDEQTNGYYRVRTTDGEEGWIYRTFVRRYPGDLEPSRDDAVDGSAATTTAVRGEPRVVAAPESSVAEALFDRYSPYDPAGMYFVYAGLPKTEGYPGSIEVLKNEGFVTGYDESRRNPAWSAYRVFPFTRKSTPNRPSFRPDRRTRAQVKDADYVRSGYSRGHMAPNYAILQCYGMKAQIETFLLSNACPQFQSLNNGSWKQLEDLVANTYGQQLEEVWVIAGPIYDGRTTRIPAGVEIPDGFFMILLDELDGEPRAMAFHFDHRDWPGEPLEDALTSIDEIEAEAHLDFFSELDDETENQLEQQHPSQLWAVESRPR